MDTTTIIFAIAYFGVGLVASWCIFRRGKKSNVTDDDLCELSKIKELNTKLESELKSSKVQVEELSKQVASKNESSADVNEKQEQLKTHYDKLLSELQQENKRLEEAYAIVSSGDYSKENKESMAKLEASTKRITELEQEYNSIKKEYETLKKESDTFRDSLEKTVEEQKKLKKTIADLEDEVEEAEEEQEKLEKKLKTKNQELHDTQEQLEKKERDNKALNESIEKKEALIRTQLEELTLKTSSIEFVQEILSAKETGSSDIKKLYKSIDVLESFIRGQFMDCYAYLYNTYKELQYNGKLGRSGFVEKKKRYLQLLDEWASVKRKSWLDNKTTIAFVGEFSAGKTSIVNRILSQDNPKIPLLPVSAKATTAIPTYIAGGVAETYNFITPDDKLKTISENTFKKVSKEILDEIAGVSSLIKYFVMTYKNPNLKGLSILDTPGFSSNDAEDRERTIGVINECDALFWVFDVNAGTINRSSISLIKEKLNKPLIVVINKVDTKAPSEVDKVESLIRDTLSSEGLMVQQFIRFSSKEPLKSIMNPIHSIKRNEARDQFISIVSDDLNEMAGRFEDAVKEANKQENQADKECEKLANTFDNCMNSLRKACVDAAEIPHWETHFFSSDRYEMTETEGDNLIKLLEDIVNVKCENLSKAFNDEMKAVAKMQQAYSDLIDMKASWQKLDDCINEFKKATKNL